MYVGFPEGTAATEAASSHSVVRQLSLTEWPLSECLNGALYDESRVGPSQAFDESGRAVDRGLKLALGAGETARVAARAERTTYRELFLCALQRHRILVIGLYRRLEQPQQQQHVRPATDAGQYVVTFPAPTLTLRFSDLVTCLHELLMAIMNKLSCYNVLCRRSVCSH